MSSSEQSRDKEIDFKYNLKIYWQVLRSYKGFMIGLAVAIILLECSYTFDKFLFKTVIDNGTDFISGALTKEGYLSILFGAFLLFLASMIIRLSMKWLQIHLINKLDGGAMYDIKRKFLEHMVRLSHGFHTNHKTGSLISKLIRSSGAVERMTDTIFFTFIPLVVQIIVVSSAVFYFSMTAVMIILAVIASYMGFSFYVNQKQRKANMEANDAEDIEKGVISDIFTNIESIKYFGKEKAINDKYMTFGEKTKAAMIRHWNYFRWLSAGQHAILAAGTVAVIFYSAAQVLDSKMTIGTLVFIYTVYGSLLGNLYSFDHGLRNYYRSMADFESLFKYYKIENDIKDVPDAKNLKIEKGTVEFRNVSFAYKKQRLFQSLNLKVPKNKKVALIGPSGAGKSTLIKLIYRLYDLNEGQILIDGKDISAVKQESLRSELSIVPQECVLFDDSIYNNIAFSKPGATRKEVFDAMRFAQLDKIIERMPCKEDTIVGERGVKLSGGEKQRVSIARALLADKKILMLDEATSSLDSETEHEIQKDLARLMKNRTTIIIAHRLSTIMSADKIVVIDKGKVVQIGTHNDLIRKDGLYKKLWNLQKGGYLKQ